MGVIKLWQALDRGGAVESLEGHHAHIVEAVENKVSSTGTVSAGLPAPATLTAAPLSLLAAAAAHRTRLWRWTCQHGSCRRNPSLPC